MEQFPTNDNSELLSVIQNPFNFNNISSIRLFSYDNYEIGAKSNKKFKATVEFTNGNTNGSQSFLADNMDECYLKMRAFIAEMNKKNEQKRQ